MEFRSVVSYRIRPLGYCGVWEIEEVPVCGRGRHHNRQLADLRQKGDAGNGQRGGVVRRYFGNGAEAGKGGGKRGRVPEPHFITDFSDAFLPPGDTWLAWGLVTGLEWAWWRLLVNAAAGNVRCGVCGRDTVNGV